MRITFVSWARQQSRSAALAARLGASMHFVHRGRGGNPWSAPRRYIAQARETWAVWRRERPEVIVVQNPPLPLVLLAYAYCRRHGARYVIDSHTGAFLSAPWRQFTWLHRLLARRALISLVHNWAQGELIGAWTCPAMVLINSPLMLSAGEAAALDGAFRVFVVCSYAQDEPIEAIVEAARALPEVRFYLSGDSSRMAPRLRAALPANCRCTGYVPYDEYLSLARAADVVMALTTRDGTLLEGAFEAVALRRPLILSDWPVLRHYFDAGVVHAANTAADLAAAVCRARDELPSLQRGIEDLAERLDARWQEQFAVLQDVLAGEAAASTVAARTRAADTAGSGGDGVRAAHESGRSDETAV